jgi:transcriptional regulator with XRE-family HTH domain
MKEGNISKAELSRRLEIKPQSVDYLLGRKSIDTDTLYKVSVALGYDFAKFYSIGEQTNSDKIEFDIKPKNAKILLEIELRAEDVVKLNLKKRVLKILNDD